MKRKRIVIASLLLISPLSWHALILKKKVYELDGIVFIQYQDHRTISDGHVQVVREWRYERESGEVSFADWKSRTWTTWDKNSEVIGQLRLDSSEETRDSPPWWPHPPLIDLREFEE